MDQDVRSKRSDKRESARKSSERAIYNKKSVRIVETRVEKNASCKGQGVKKAK